MHTQFFHNQLDYLLIYVSLLLDYSTICCRFICSFNSTPKHFSSLLLLRRNTAIKVFFIFLLVQIIRKVNEWKCMMVLVFIFFVTSIFNLFFYTCQLYVFFLSFCHFITHFNFLYAVIKYYYCHTILKYNHTNLSLILVFKINIC